MTKNTITLRILPEENWISVPVGISARDALSTADVVLADYCGGQGLCGKCRVQFLEGAPDPSYADDEFLEKNEIEQGFRLACMARLDNDAAILVPFETRTQPSQVLVKDVEAKPIAADSGFKKIQLKIAPASLENQLSDFDLLRQAVKIENLRADLALLKKLPFLLRESDYSLTLSLCEDDLLDIEAGDTAADVCALGAAIDLGTTTIAGALYHLESGKLLSRAGRLNPQTIHGADIISRIQYASASPKNRKEISALAAAGINEVIRELCAAASVSADAILSITLAGNTTMQHLFLETPADFLPTAPYVPVFKDALNLSAGDAGLQIHQRARLFVFPSIGGFVGGDTVADMLIASLENSAKPSLMIDIGTNGEIVLGAGKRLIATSAAAGPAFEGRNIACGIRAESGAIDSVSIVEKVSVHTIGDAPASGICGSGLLSAISAFRQKGVIDASGRFNTNALPSLKDRFFENEEGLGFMLIRKNEGAQRDIFLTQKDIRQFQLAKGAIAAAVQLLLKEYGIAASALDKIYIAGAFGNFINPEDALIAGLIPAAEKEQIKFIGNAALAGASETLLRTPMRAKALELARRTAFIELAGRPDFQDIFAESMMFGIF